MVNWWLLIKERFSPAQYLPMIFLFTLGNGFWALKINGASWNWFNLIGALLLMTSFFFRMRLFDEIKDYEVDLKVNPNRPLARGLLSIIEVKKVLLYLIIFEVILSLMIGWRVVLVHAFAIFYSLLMYEEFFIGPQIRPLLTTYAVSHTFVSVLLSYSVATIFVPYSNKLSLTFFLMNWMYFNLFEFARKTFSIEEERSGVDTYSSLFGIKNAILLSYSQVVMGLLLLALSVVGYGLRDITLRLSLVLLLGLIYMMVGLVFWRKSNKKNAKIFRLLSGLYLLIHYFSLMVLFY